MTDATCYESYLRFPTDMKLLWEAVSWLHPHMCSIYKSMKLKKPRSKFDKQSQRYPGYSKKRKRRQTETRVLKRSLLHLLNKLIGLTDNVIKGYSKQIKLSPRFYKRYTVIKSNITIYRKSRPGQRQPKFSGYSLVDIHLMLFG